MKKTLLTLALVTASVAAFAQGKISFQTDSLHLAYYTDTGAAIPTGSAISASLYMGTTANQLFLYNTTSWSAAAAGRWNTASVAANANATTGATAIAGGTQVFVVAVVTDGTPLNSINPTTVTGADFAGAKYFGASQEFTFTLGSSVTYPPMYGSAGTWAAGQFALDSVGAGYKGAIAVAPVPEPATMALAGLGAAALMIFRRRK